MCVKVIVTLLSYRSRATVWENCAFPNRCRSTQEAASPRAAPFCSHLRADRCYAGSQLLPVVRPVLRTTEQIKQLADRGHHTASNPSSRKPVLTSVRQAASPCLSSLSFRTRRRLSCRTYGLLHPSWHWRLHVALCSAWNTTPQRPGSLP